MSAIATEEKYCVIGAGSSGLAVARNFRELGVPFDCLEREGDLGGNWNIGQPSSRVYRSTRLISSKRLTEYRDFPMPAEWPEHPPHGLVLTYLREYARHFGLLEHIEFNAGVSRLERAEPCRPLAPRAAHLAERDDYTGKHHAERDEYCGGGWVVTLADGSRRRYRGVVIANGHNWDPRWPEYSGRFDGEVLHSSAYKAPEIARERRVLVVGGGNSGFDIATDISPVATATFHSLRRNYHVLPRFQRGAPIDECGEWMLRWRVPLWLRRLLNWPNRWLVWEADAAASLPTPDHRLFETHPVINSRWPYEVARGAVRVKPDIRELCGGEVVFADGSRERVDIIIYATGYKLSFPFIDSSELNWRDGRPELYLNVFHPERDDLFVVGMIQPDSGQFGLVDEQARLVAEYLIGLSQGTLGARRFRKRKLKTFESFTGGANYVGTPRHLLEVEHFCYRRRLRRAIGGLRVRSNLCGKIRGLTQRR